MSLLQRRSSAVCLSLLLLTQVLFPLVAGAQEEPPLIRRMQTVFGAVDDAAPEARWQFEAVAGERVSVLVQPVGGALDPYVQLLDPNGDVLAENDDIAYPERLSAALEGIEIPRAGVYTIRVTRYGFEAGDSAGDFALTLLPGYAAPALWETFSDGGVWSVGEENRAEAQVVDGQLELTATAQDALVWAVPADAETLPAQAYLQVEAGVQNDPDYWEYGLVFRQSSPENFYVFAVSSRGDWAFLAHTGPSAWRAIQDWTAHPALRDPEPHGVLGVLMDGSAFTFFYNGVELATASDDTYPDPGTVGVSAGTVDRQETLPVIRYDNLLATVPLPPMLSAVEAIRPEPLSTWEARDPTPIVAELEQQGVIPGGARTRMFVPESFVEISRAGMNHLSLGQGRTQTDFVMGTTIRLDSHSAENGCGLIFRRAGDDHYSLFFVDGRPGYGVAVWSGGRFEPAFYALGGGETGTALLRSGTDTRALLVGQGDRLQVYLNGQWAATQPNPALNGGVGIVALSFDSTFVNCRFFNTWLWTWE